jgi:hypothetical protein
MHKYWIDIQTGTWGHCDNLRIVDLEAVAQPPDTTPQDLVRQLQDSSDAEIAVFGDRHGRRVAP